ncbi:cupin [Streptomyces sp. SH5]|uniref:1,2-dihydroxy-3-keto-5-methylthiopentene dioxygenase n=1 Tax=Streptomyces sp. SH5 TaxID=3041765 RepID=UPI0024782475|nr:cupin [Streptomyces sp. SH5]WGP13946.1 cupin [Streptomyces sp. SH5]
MTLLQIMPDDAPDTVLLRTRDEDVIARALRERSVSFTRWPRRADVTPQTSSEELLDAYRAEVDELCADQGLRLVDTARLHPEEGEEWRERAARARSTFLDEHRHAEDEVRFFAHGTGCFYLHLDDRVYAVVCEAGDLLSVPAGTRHWFDMGPVPDFCAIRFFEKEDGWVGDFTQEPIAGRFPRLDALLREG